MESQVQLNEVAQQLDAHIEALPESKKGFAGSLVSQQLRGKKLSDKQVFWLNKLHEMALSPEPKPEVRKLATSVSLLPVIAMFDKVAMKLKSPGFDMEVADTPVRVYRSAYGKYPGSVYVTPGDRQPGWFGRVEKDGTFTAGPKADELPWLEQFLEEFAEAPDKVASNYGRKTGRCCFCSLPLKDARSTHVGYGRTCAKNWELPYPKMSEVAQ